jgi:hypothetical protein
MLALTLDTAKNVAIGVIAVMVIAALVAARIVASITKRVIAIAIFAGLAVAVWSQRAQLQTCADRVQANVEAGQATTVKTTCEFFGRDITIVDPSPDEPAPAAQPSLQP